MRILMIGGTAFVGRHIAAAALDAGHDLTLFHRGKTGADLFPQATHLNGNRDEDLSALANGSYDATIDLCAYFPRRVRSLAAVLDGRGGTYVFISSVSAYSPSVPANYDESAQLADVDDPEAAEVTNENYGGLKVVCEQVSTELFGPDTTIIRPTYVIGPFDRTYRFTWWVDQQPRRQRAGAPTVPGLTRSSSSTPGIRQHSRSGCAGAFDHRHVPHGQPGTAVRLRPDAGGDRRRGRAAGHSARLGG